MITTPVNDAISIDFKPMKIPPGTVRPTQVATVTFDRELTVFSPFFLLMYFLYVSLMNFGFIRSYVCDLKRSQDNCA